jgi:hypothetical protein
MLLNAIGITKNIKKQNIETTTLIWSDQIAPTLSESFS